MSKHIEGRQLEWAFQLWKRYIREDLKFEEPNEGNGQLRRARELLQWSKGSLAEKMKVNRLVYSRLEASEASGKIWVNDLRKACEAMGCELKIEIRPKNGKTFVENLWQEICEELVKHPRLNSCIPGQRYRVLYLLARERMKSAKFRREKNWNERSRGKKEPYWFRVR